MKLYICSGAPSPERVTAFLRAKQIELELIEVDLRNGEHMTAAFQRLNPMCTVPVLQLDDGDTLWDTCAIRGYLEALHPQPALLGADARERAEVAMWEHWVVINGLHAVMNAFRNAAPGFAMRALPGPHDFAQMPELAARDRQRFAYFLADLDQRLQQHQWIAGDGFSVVDIDARITIDFARRAIKLEADAGLKNLQRWYDALSARKLF
jgi:glutathione S-transferase